MGEKFSLSLERNRDEKEDVGEKENPKRKEKDTGKSRL